MKIKTAMEWVKRNCNEETVLRLRSRKVAETLHDHLVHACRIIRDEYPATDERYIFAVSVIGEDQ